LVSEPTILTGCGCVSDRRPIDHPERRERPHAGRDQRENRCPVYQDREADRRSAAKGNESRACTGKEADRQTAPRETDPKAAYEAEHGRFQHRDHKRQYQGV